MDDLEEPVGHHCFEAQICRGDFWIMLREAVEQAGGSPDAVIDPKMTLGDAVDILAQNGLRIVHMPEKSVSHVRFAEPVRAAP